MKLSAHIHRISQINYLCSTLLAISLLTTASYATAAASTSIFGPKRYDRLKGQPTVYTDTFDRCNTSEQAILKVTNGNSNDTRIKAALISINGNKVISENEFKQHVPAIEKIIQIGRTNQLRVELKSGQQDDQSETVDKGQSFLIIEIVGPGCDETGPAIFAPVPGDGSLINSAIPQIAVQYADDGAGIDVTTARIFVDEEDVTGRATTTLGGINVIPAASLQDGSHTVTVNVSDLAQNSSSLTWRFTNDATPPVVEITSHQDNQYVNRQTQTLSGTLSEPISVLTVNGFAATVTGTNFYISELNLNEGSNTVTINAVDLAGNVGSKSITINLDTVSPTTTVTPAGGLFNTSLNVYLNSNEAVTIYYTLDETLPTTASPVYLGPLPIRVSTTIKYFAVDLAGNNEVLKNATFTIDNEAPVLTVVMVPDGTYTKSALIIITGTVRDNLQLQNLNINGENLTVNADGTFTHQLMLTEGTNVITITATDTAENTASDTRTITLDTTPPVTSLLTYPSAPDGLHGWFVTVPSITLVSDESGTTYYKWGDSSIGYAVSRQSNEWVSEGTPLSIRGDDTGSWYLLPFNFAFYGTAYSQVYISSNGLISFTQDNSYSNSGSGLVSKTAIAPLWDDLRTDSRTGDDVYVYVFQPDADSVCFRWQTITYSGYIDTNFEVILYRDGRIRFNYGAQGGGLSPTIGISKGDGTNFNIVYDNNVSSTNYMESVEYLPLDWNVYHDPLVTEEVGPLFYYSVDNAGNREEIKSQSFRVDAVAPVGTVTINGGASATNSTVVTLNLTCNDNAGSGCEQMQIRNDNIEWQSPESYSGTKSWDLGDTDGSKIVYARFQDAAGNWSPVVSYTIMLDATPPTTLLSVNPSAPDGANGWFKTVPFITLTSNEAGNTYYKWGESSVVGYSFSRQAHEWVSGGTALNIRGDDTGAWYTLPFTFTFYGTNYTQIYLSSNGLIRFGAADTNYNNSGPGLIGKAAIAPLWDDLRTDSRTGDDVYVYAFQLDANSICFRWQAATYSGGYNTNFETILYRDGRIRFNYGSQGGGLSPTIGISKGDGSNYHIAYDNNNSNTNNMESILYIPSGWRLYADSVVTMPKENILYYYSLDTIGNNETQQSQLFRIDPSPPAGTIAISNEAAYTTSTSTALTLSCTDEASGCARMQFSNDNTIWSAPEPYTQTKTWTLTEGDGLKTVYVLFQDNAGNLSSVFNDTITLDTMIPTVTISSPAHGLINNNKPLLQYTVSDGTVTVKVDGTTVSTRSGSNLSILTEGVHIARVESRDAAGNIGYSEVTFTVDTIPPTVTINPVTSPTPVVNQIISGSTESGATITVSVNTSASIGLVSYPSSTTWRCEISSLVLGANTITVTATDAAGNNTAVSATIESTALPEQSLQNVGGSSNRIDVSASESITIFFTLTTSATVTFKIIPEMAGPTGSPVYSASQVCPSSGAYLFTWDGRNNAGQFVPDEAYLYILEAATDGSRSGLYNPPAPSGIGTISCSQDSSFDPYKNDPLSISFGLSQPARVNIDINWEKVNFAVMNRIAHATGNYYFEWDGRDASGRLFPGAVSASCKVSQLLRENTVVTTGNTPKISMVITDPYKVDLSYGQFTRIKYTLVHNANVSIDIISPTGRSISVINNQYQAAGAHEIEWNGLDANDVTGKRILVSMKDIYTVKIQATNPDTGASSTAKGTLFVGE